VLGGGHVLGGADTTSGLGSTDPTRLAPAEVVALGNALENVDEAALTSSGGSTDGLVSASAPSVSRAARASAADLRLRRLRLLLTDDDDDGGPLAGVSGVLLLPLAWTCLSLSGEACLDAVVDGVGARLGARALRTAAAERPAFSRWEAAHHLTVMTNAASITIHSLSQP
jgi:hypothetical protein